MKNKVKIIYLASFVMTKSKWFEREMDHFEENSDIETHELCDFLYPSARKVLKETYKSKKIFAFKKFSDWKNYILNLQQKLREEKKKLVILTELSQYPRQGYSLKYLMVNKFLNQQKIDYYEFNVSWMSSPKATTGTYLKYIKIFKYWRYLLIRINEILASFFGSLLNIKPKGIFVSGSRTKKRLEYFKKTKGIELIDFNSWELSSTINKNSNGIDPIKKKYAVYIKCEFLPRANMNNFKKKSDESILHVDSTETFEKWYPALDNFLSYLEKIFNLKIIIASHPKSDNVGSLDYLGNRTAILNKTEELVRGSEFVISRNSSALTYAIVYKKPIFFIYSNETKRHVGNFSSINTLSSYFKIESINIDENISENQIKSLMNFDEKLYNSYMKEFLTSNLENKNYRIILNYLNK